MRLCLVTDRRRLGQALGRPTAEWCTTLVEQIAAAVEAGIDMVQLRETDLDARELLKLANAIVADVPGARRRLVVNERLDVAIAAGAAGVHLRERSLQVSDARKLAGHGFWVGRSVHDAAGAHAASSASYLIAGTVLSTPSKKATRLLGWDGLAGIVGAAGGRPVLGIGGLSVDSVPHLVRAGASGLAAIGAFIPREGQNLQAFVQGTVENLRLAFDSTESVP